jgi:hypothetical protein
MIGKFRMPVRRALVFSILLTVLFLSSCGGGKDNSNPGPPTNVGGGYTLKASGGTLNDGTGVNGLAILATLRDNQGWGPTIPWTITITGPGISADYPLTLEYSDPRRGSYMSWEWSGFDPLPGSYRATATNGSATIHYDFTVKSAVLSRPAPNASVSGNDMTVSWPAVANAKSYGYAVCGPGSECISGITTDTSEIASFATLTTGDYFIQIAAYATDRSALYVSHKASPALAPQENVSEYQLTFPVGGDQTESHYGLNAAGGVLDFGLRGPNNTPIYGLAIWTSIQDTTNPGNPTAPSGDWNITITDPNGVVMNYLYFAGDRHYEYWYYNVEPVAGTYLVTATYGAATKTASFSLANTTPNLAPLSYDQISASLVPNAGNAAVNDISITWPAVTGATSYYVSLWADIWNNVTNQYEYSEVWGNWVSATNTRVLNGDVVSGLTCDVYITASATDMASATPPSPVPGRADMSENYYGYPVPFVTPQFKLGYQQI